ncbi:UDP-3-O-(3-hydroxymyristoyl)glucosamine N-acyltransferase [Marinomonas ostreistagni]|uniref:UDP-3-O-(3-hydroxymyristoyl)glucosamine N-acyltransferase n=1 Tax=Marinomonas ostreistagni TaxID=359209 RepID=UPI00194F1197|nr:UDP-3-O-(3-hydroxymyristoyl)glucosamine N-acyltransferase [Marinomonas ostreistagni]MBM6551673.1 UDP-3-O-(3-hydroxymyristoyl)glucosamine N-acyltransferase [Marinomonas ostreistagni]
MGYSLSEIAAYVGGELLGDPDYEVASLGALDHATSNQLSFLSNPKYAGTLTASEAGAVLLRNKDDADKVRNAILVRNPYYAFAQVTQLFVAAKIDWAERVHASAVVHETAELADDVVLGPNVVIGAHTRIAEGCRIESGSVVGEGVEIAQGSSLAANVTLYRGVKIGQRCIIHSGAVIGADGFGFAPNNGAWQKIHQLGSVVIGDDVEVGANTTIDCGAIDNTVIGNGVKIDNLVQIAHNVVIGDNSAIAGCVGIAGSTTIGQSCTIAGGAGLAGHLVIGDQVHITAMSLVTRSIKQPGSYSSGTALDSTANWRKSAARLRRIEHMADQISKLEKQVKTLLTKG